MSKQRWIKIVLVCMATGFLGTAGWIGYHTFSKTVILARASDPRRTVPGDIRDPEEYAVYAVVLADDLGDKMDLFVIDNQTGLGYFDIARYEKMGFDKEDIKPFGPEFNSEMWNDFLDKDSVPSRLGNAFALDKPYLLVAAEEVNYVNMQLWIAHVKYTPYLTVSRVGFNPGKDEALVHRCVKYLSHSIPKAFAFSFGYFYWLKKVDGVWTIEKNREPLLPARNLTSAIQRLRASACRSAFRRE